MFIASYFSRIKSYNTYVLKMGDPSHSIFKQFIICTLEIF